MTLEKITSELFEKLVELAQFSLDPAESEYLRSELNHQLAAVKELSEIPIDVAVAPTTHGLEVEGRRLERMNGSFTPTPTRLSP